MIRVILDANVLAPGFLSKTSAPARLIQLWRQAAFELVVSEHVLDELGRTYTDPYYRRRITPERVERVLRLLRRRAFVTEITVVVTGVATQPKDDLVLATGLSAGASYLATRDKQLLRLDQYRDLRIVAPGQLLALLSPDS